MLGLRLAIAAIALMGVMTAGVGALALIGYETSAAPATVVFQADGNDPYWQNMIAGAQAAAADKQVELMILQDCRLPEAGTAVLSVVGGEVRATCGLSSGGSDFDFHVGMANYKAGSQCASLARELASYGGKVVAIVDDASTELAAVRLQGFRDALNRISPVTGNYSVAALKLVVEKVDDAHAASADDQLAAIASRHSDAVLVLDFTGGSALAMKRHFRDGDGGPLLITFDQSDEALNLVETGDVAAIIAHDSFQCGYLAVERLIMFHRGNAMSRPSRGKGILFLPPIVVRPGDVAEFRASLKLHSASGS
jgi:ABC-type sugar transport system substrate-binding protein